MDRKPKSLINWDDPQPTEENDEVWPIGVLPGGTLNEYVPPQHVTEAKRVKMSDRASQHSKFAKGVRKMFDQYGLEACRLNAHHLGGSEQDVIRCCIYWLSDVRPPVK